MQIRGKSSPRSNRTWHLTVKNLKSMVRDRGQLAWLIGYPLLLIVVFSAAFGAGDSRSTFDVAIINNDIVGIENPRIYWSGNASLIVVDVFNTTLKDTVSLHDDVTYEQAIDMIETEELDAVIVIDEFFSESIRDNTGPKITITTSPDPITGGVIPGIVGEIVNTIQLRRNNITTLNITISQVKDIAQLSEYDYLAPGFVVVGTLVVISQLALHFEVEK